VKVPRFSGRGLRAERGAPRRHPLGRIADDAEKDANERQRVSHANEARVAKQRARERGGESEGRSPLG
jgi:hypothetical protein